MTTKSTQHAGTHHELLASVARLQPLLRENTSVSDAIAPAARRSDRWSDRTNTEMNGPTRRPIAVADHAVVGTGSSGSVVAARLSADERSGTA